MNSSLTDAFALSIRHSLLPETGHLSASSDLDTGIGNG
jgi:hypothetical protein